MDDIRGGTGDTLRDVLELLYTASERFSSIQVSMRTWYDDAGCERARRRRKAAQAPGSVTRLGPSMEAARGDANGRAEWVSHLWQQGTQWRYKGSMWDGSPRIVLGDNSRERYTDQLRFEDAKLADMLDPVTIIPELWLEPLGRETHAGRGAIHVSGLPRKEMEHDISPAVMWLGADAYSLLVDADRGVLLRCTALLDGAAFAGMEVLSVAFDEALSEM